MPRLLAVSERDGEAVVPLGEAVTLPDGAAVDVEVVVVPLGEAVVLVDGAAVDVVVVVVSLGGAAEVVGGAAEVVGGAAEVVDGAVLGAGPGAGAGAGTEPPQKPGWFSFGVGFGSPSRHFRQ